MASINTAALDRPVEQDVSPSQLPDLTPDLAASALSQLVEHSGDNYEQLGEGIHASSLNLLSLPWIHKLIPGLEHLAVKFHMGNYVKMRGTGEKFFEAMPLYARIGMHLLFYGKLQQKVLQYDHVEALLKSMSIREGQIYDSPSSTAAIPSFIKTYSLQTDELLQPDIQAYKTFNEFFARQLKPGARPVQDEEDPSVVCSAADCRLAVYESIRKATKFWVKGKEFTIPALLNCSKKAAKPFENASLAIFRLAPSDYHRFHCPIDGTIGDIVDIPGQYYTVNPQAVNQPACEVFTANTRSILYMTHQQTGQPVAIVAIGALLVGSIKWTKGREKGTAVKRGEELGFDTDLVENSKEPVETLVKVGYRIGSTSAAPAQDSDKVSRPKKWRRMSAQFFSNMAFSLKNDHKTKDAHSSEITTTTS